MTDVHRPVLPGAGGTDHERYLRTDELLALQKSPADWRHRDELLFQIIHQSSELWLKLAGVEADDAAERLDAEDVWAGVRRLRRANDGLDLVIANSRMLEHLSPWDYHEVRASLGHGSGFDSPGFRHVHDVSTHLARAFDALLDRRGLDLPRLYRDSADYEDVFQIAERLLDWDQRLIEWRALHLKLVERVIGGHVIGTQGTPVEVLGRRVDVRQFPALWDVRNTLTRERA